MVTTTFRPVMSPPMTTLRFNRGLAALLVIITSSSALAAPSFDAAAFEKHIRLFFKDHCTKCHGSEQQKGKLRLDTLALPDGSDSLRATWLKISDAIDVGDMPPTKEPRPPVAAAKEAVRSISAAVAAVSKVNPLALRRLNRVEYENTLHDLLGIEVPLADLLPEDSSVQGFDNVADGLSISSVLMERYLEAADVAFESTIRRIKPIEPVTKRIDMMQVKENIESVKQKRAGSLEVENSFVKFAPGWPPVRMDDIHPTEDGVYECKLAVWPYQPNQRTLVLAVYVGPLFGPGQRRFMGMYDVTGSPQAPRVIEFTTRMKTGDALHLVPWIYPSHVTYRDNDKEGRPGIAVAWAQLHGPIDQDFPSETQRKLLGDQPMIEGDRVWMRNRKDARQHLVHSTNPKADAQRIVKEFIPRAFRRPVSEQAMEPYIKLTLDRLEEGRTFEQAVRAGITAVLCSPHFLLLNQDVKVDDFTLASRLSYFLWSSLPDAELMKLAEGGKLRDKKVLHEQVERMINDPRIDRFVHNFTGQWLDLRAIEFTTPDKNLYPEFDELLQESMLGETRGFFTHMLKNDLSVVNFIDSDFTVLNERIAVHYGIEGVKGHEQFRVVKLPESSIRGGILTHASVLKVTANGTTTSPILRGVWVLENLLGQPAPPPPPGVPAVEPDIRGAVSIRDQMDKHRSNESCARCHVRIDPPGFALETFDPIGGQREKYRFISQGSRDAKGQPRKPLPVEAAASLADGRSFENFAGFRERLLEDKEIVIRAFAQKLLIYGTGRRVTAEDRAAVEAVAQAAAKKGHGLRSMIHAVVDSELFTRP